MDEQLRAQPDDVVTLLRAGRLSPERVAMAAYLGDERALAAGVETWVPPEPLGEPPAPWGGSSSGSWPAQHLLKHGGLSDRRVVWLARICVNHAVSEHWEPEVGPSLLLTAVREWCLGRFNRRLSDAWYEENYPNPEDRDYEPTWAFTEWLGVTADRVLAASLQTLDESLDSEDVDADEEHGFLVTNSADSPHYLAHAVLCGEHIYEAGFDEIQEALVMAQYAFSDQAKERAWQAQAIADVLLDPDWPPWEE